ncbi:MAG: hypothetical protein K6F80_02125, partial [Oscillospiraceae bacterium]|nr:hypothetical protein [Oscillospiraceae bacterium]
MEKTSKPKKKTKIRFDKILGSRPVAMVLSVITAIFAWFAIIMKVYPTTPLRFHNIPVIVDLSHTEANANGLSVVENEVETVEVELIGDRSQIGLLKAEDLIAFADVTGITASGQYTLSLNVETKAGMDFTVKSITPAQTTVKLDKIETRTFAVEPSFPNIVVTSGHALNREDVSCTPSTVDITGPSAQLADIGKVVVYSDKAMEISNSYMLYS